MLTRQRITLRNAIASDWVKVFGGNPPDCEWFGVAACDQYMIHGLGGCFKQDNGIWVAWVTVSPGSHNARALLEAAKMVISEAKQRGLTVTAAADPKFKRSGQFLKHLGFHRTKRKHQGAKIWMI